MLLSEIKTSYRIEYKIKDEQQTSIMPDVKAVSPDAAISVFRYTWLALASALNKPDVEDSYNINVKILKVVKNV